VKTIKLLAPIFCFLSSPLLAQNDAALSNLLFTPVPVSIADNSVLVSEGILDDARRSAEENIPRLMERINAAEMLELPDPDQVQRINTLGLALQTLGRHEEALERFAEASALAVDIHGEGALEQIPSLEQSILSHLALNEIDAVTEKEEFIYALRVENFAADSPEMYSAMTNLADWYTAAYFKINYLDNSRRQNIRSTTTQRAQRQIGIEGGNASMQAIADGSVRDVNINDVIDLRLRKIDDLYEEYQESYTSNTTLNIAVEVARRIARLAYHAEQEMNLERYLNDYDPNYTGSREEAVRNSEERRDESYNSGERALEYVADLIASVEDISAQQLALAMLDLADWDLAYGRSASAREYYRVAYQVLRDDNFNDASIDAALAPTIPVPIPRIAAFPATPQTAGGQGLSQIQSFKGYIDISFTIDELGNASGINFLGSTEDENSNRIQNLLETFIRMNKYRPLLQGGELNAMTTMNLRYYYNY
tara:strand:+ start:84007 stop:85449 length:1443 start_codon:yes stop_codon:yes gene_type:complete